MIRRNPRIKLSLFLTHPMKNVFISKYGISCISQLKMLYFFSLLSELDYYTVRSENLSLTFLGTLARLSGFDVGFNFFHFLSSG